MPLPTPEQQRHADRVVALTASIRDAVFERIENAKAHWDAGELQLLGAVPHNVPDYTRFAAERSLRGTVDSWQSLVRETTEQQLLPEPPSLDDPHHNDLIRSAIAASKGRATGFKHTTDQALSFVRVLVRRLDSDDFEFPKSQRRLLVDWLNGRVSTQALLEREEVTAYRPQPLPHQEDDSLDDAWTKGFDEGRLRGVAWVEEQVAGLRAEDTWRHRLNRRLFNTALTASGYVPELQEIGLAIESRPDLSDVTEYLEYSLELLETYERELPVRERWSAMVDRVWDTELATPNGQELRQLLDVLELGEKVQTPAQLLQVGSSLESETLRVALLTDKSPWVFL